MWFPVKANLTSFARKQHPKTGAWRDIEQAK